jgi:L-ascorbate metabolism protein UlaG (beta-lactamase superfamily)
MGTLSITYAGHSAVIIDIAGARVAIDPWLKGNPLCPAELQSPGRLDLIAVTHGHADHASDVVRVQKETNSMVAATYELAMIFIAEGVPSDKVIPMNKGGAVQCGSVTVRLTDAFHSSSFDGKNGTVYAGEACGVVISGDSKTVYHAGDTSLFSDMKLIGELYQPNVALLPIGDRFTMGPAEAAKAASLIRAQVVCPIHYKTFPLLTGTYSEFAAACDALDVSHLEIGVGERKSF